MSQISSRVGSGEARITGLEFLDKERQTKNIICSGDELVARLHFEVQKAITDLHIGLEIYNDVGALVTCINNWMAGSAIPKIAPGKYFIDLEIQMLNLMPGAYRLTLWLRSTGSRNIDVLEHCVTMDVETTDYYGSGRGIDRRFGQVFLPAHWKDYQMIS